MRSQSASACSRGSWCSAISSAAAVRALVEERPSSLIGEERGRIVEVPFDSVESATRPLDPALIDLVHSLAV